jgi:hypothetical protein
MSRCQTAYLVGGKTSISVDVARDPSGSVVPLSCQELRCDPASSFCLEGASCQPLPAACRAAPTCKACFPNQACSKVGDQLRVEAPAPP